MTVLVYILYMFQIIDDPMSSSAKLHQHVSVPPGPSLVTSNYWSLKCANLPVLHEDENTSNTCWESALSQTVRSVCKIRMDLVQRWVRYAPLSRLGFHQLCTVYICTPQVIFYNKRQATSKPGLICLSLSNLISTSQCKSFIFLHHKNLYGGAVIWPRNFIAVIWPRNFIFV